mmetsp:Transcript_38552/g.87615  ORF Transcript_38552/g.87615 Transcript_38552/m.87615 type:complete len:386 (+) Transcript_38552:1584-2741(+)
MPSSSFGFGPPTMASNPPKNLSRPPYDSSIAPANLLWISLLVAAPARCNASVSAHTRSIMPSIIASLRSSLASAARSLRPLSKPRAASESPPNPLSTRGWQIAAATIRCTAAPSAQERRLHFSEAVSPSSANGASFAPAGSCTVTDSAAAIALAIVWPALSMAACALDRSASASAFALAICALASTCAAASSASAFNFCSCARILASALASNNNFSASVFASATARSAAAFAATSSGGSEERSENTGGSNELRAPLAWSAATHSRSESSVWLAKMSFCPRCLILKHAMQRSLFGLSSIAPATGISNGVVPGVVSRRIPPCRTTSRSAQLPTPFCPTSSSSLPRISSDPFPPTQIYGSTCSTLPAINAAAPDCDSRRLRHIDLGER